jgi:hypothetical protein
MVFARVLSYPLAMKHPIGGLVVVLLAANLASCAAPPRLYWYKSGASQQDFARDDYQCRRENTVTGSDTTYTPPNLLFPRGLVTTSPTVEVNSDLFGRCMAARGWSLQEAASSSVSPTPASAPSPAPSSPSKKRDLKDVPECAWGEYWHSVKKQCVKIGTD